MEFRVLGPLEVIATGPGGAERTDVPVPAGQLRVLLASLLCRANEVLSFEELRDQLWSDTDSGSTSTVRSYVRRLRDVLNAADPSREFIQHRPPGYLLVAEPSEVDLLRFRELTARARAAEPAQAAKLLDEALRLWRGPALADVRSAGLHRDVVPALADERLLAVEQWADAELALGQHARVIGELTTQTARHPLRERFCAQLMLALRHSGRQADALERYRVLQTTLAEELGIDPSEELRELHQSILLDSHHRPEEPGTTPPYQLAADVRTFVGREPMLERIERELSSDPRQPGLGLVVINGAPGTGKTALAVRAAHRMRSMFPDGQLFVDLRGYSDGPPVAGEQALGRFLRALGVSPQGIPSDVDEQAALYRSLLADRQVLVVLDNAATSQQVRALLPGSSSCAVLVTSRNNLRGLVASEGARELRLDVLPAPDSLTLLENVLDERPAAELESLPDLADACGHLPLALRIAAAQLTVWPQLDIAEYVRELRQGNGLEALTVPDDETSVRAAFDLSYAALKPEPQRLFRLSGLVPGQDFSAPLAAALLGVTSVQPVLDRLVATNLLVRHGRGRYTLHDLLRRYAAERAARDESPESLDAARHRLFGYYAHSVEHADQWMRGSALTVPLPELPPEAQPSTFTDYQQAMSWCEAERVNLVAAVHEAHRLEYHRHAYTMPIYLLRFFNLTRHSADWIDTHEVGLSSARQARNRLAEAILLFRLGDAYQEFRDVADALPPLHEALSIARELDAQLIETAVTNLLGVNYWLMGHLGDARSYFERALAAYRENGNRYGEAGVLTNLGYVYAQTGNFPDAIAYGQQAVQLTREFGDPNYQGVAWQYLGEAHDRRGSVAEAASAYRNAIAVARECRDQQTEALSSWYLGRNRAGERGEARALLERALHIFTELGDPRAAEIREDLATLPD